MKIFIVSFFVFFILSCDSADSSYSSWYSEPEYTNEDGELGGKCFLPYRTCNHWPELYCDGEDFTCRSMPDNEQENDSDIILDNDDEPGPPDGWGGQE